MNYYTVLGVPRDADTHTIHNAYRARARQYHPDAGAGSSPAKFRDVVTAYETLSDPARRREYDASLRPRPEPIRNPMEEIVIEPLAPSGWYFASPRRPRRSMRTNVSRAPELQELFDEIFTLLERELFSRW